MKLHDSKVFSGKQVISISMILGICALGLVYAFDRELPSQDQKSASEVVGSASIVPRKLGDKIEVLTSSRPIGNADLGFVDSTIPSEEASSKNLFGEFLAWSILLILT